MKMNKDMEEKQERLDKERKEKILGLSLKQEDDFIKNYQKRQSILRLERINKYKTEKRSEELWEKEKKIEDLKEENQKLVTEISLQKAQIANDTFTKDSEINKYKSLTKKYKTMLEEKGLLKNK